MVSTLLVSLLCSIPLPEGPSPEPLLPGHFPDRLHAFVWRNWDLAPVERMAAVVQTTPENILALGKAMGLPDPPAISEAQLQRTYITIIRANWHLLPYEQLTALLGWTESKLAFTLREDDFLYIKLGSLKPACEPLLYAPPDDEAVAREAAIAAVARAHFGDDAGAWIDPPLSFIEKLSAPLENKDMPPRGDSVFDPRYCYSYFALYGDPLLEHDPFPEGYLQRLASVGVNGVWLHAVLYKLSPFPWDPSISDKWKQRLERLNALVIRAARYGVGVYLYMNEPRAMPAAFFEDKPELRGVPLGDYATLCTSAPEVRSYITNAIAIICAAAPDLAGFFTITASENPTNCWSHYRGAECPRCANRGPAEVIAEVNATILAGMRKVNSRAKLFAWDWGWREDFAPETIKLLPDGVALMSVSEWHSPISRGGVDNTVGEYSISVVGPGPRAQKHWRHARDRGLNTLAKIQANNTWELSVIPYIPAVENVARHAAALRDSGVSGLMLSWTLGGWPSPNLDVVNEIGRRDDNGKPPTPQEAMLRVAQRRFGPDVAEAVVEAWHVISKSFSEFPYDGGVVYKAPLQAGPANLLWGVSTGYRATMVGIPYDDLNGWRGVYPPEVFISQLRKTAAGFDEGAAMLRALVENAETTVALQEEANLAETAAIHFRSVANQSEYVLLRGGEESTSRNRIKDILTEEINLAKRLYGLQRNDSRIGFEATNHYFYTPLDLVEKVLNCMFLLENAK
ncbi:MAG TPA: hypothetical protein ENN29_06825 [Candidatus Hydrogenedentes bacterium]|nr:hypothetical protein [Candidatus Hydrogenedentota bacterium]